MSKHDANPMQSAHAATRCAAKSKRTEQPCRAPAVRGWSVCRMHGARGGAQPGKEHPAYKHGLRSGDWLELRKELSELNREAREYAKLLDVQ